MTHWADQSGWKAKLVGGSYDSARPRSLMATEPLLDPPEQVHVYRCECCDTTVIVALGLHPHEDMLGPRTVYRLDDVQLQVAVYVHEDLAGDALREYVSRRELAGAAT
jgi:hypothetical protein